MVRTLAVTRGAALEMEGWRHRLVGWGIGLGGVARVVAARFAAAMVTAARVTAARVAAARAVVAVVAVVTVAVESVVVARACLRAFWLARRARPTRELYLAADSSPESSRD